jgi:tetratricopeptide (TPR) repeat protein
MEWPRLANAVNDAKGAAWLFKQLGFVEATAPLLDEAATCDAMRRLVTEDLAHLSQDDSLVLFFAGHGHTHVASVGDTPVKIGCVIPVDARGPRGHVSASWLQLDSWLRDIARLPPRHILVIIDACHGGVALSAAHRWRDAVARTATDLDALQTRHSRRIITSALDDQRALDNGPRPGHSLFTGCLIEGLSGGIATDGRRAVTGSELGVYLQQRVRSYPESNQTPDFGAFDLDDRGDIVMPVLGSRPSAREPPRIPPAANTQDVAKPRDRVATRSSGESGRAIESSEPIETIDHDRLQNPREATAVHLEAVEISSEDTQLLRKELDHYTETRQWKKAVETIKRFIALEPDPLRRGAYYHAAATVCRDELKSLDEAVDYYQKALDSYFESPERLSEATIPRALRSFKAIDEILTTRRDWNAQERVYREMLGRLPAEGSPAFHRIQVGLFDGLGEIYRSRLKHYPSATQAFEVAQQLDPHNEIRPDGTDRAEILAELYLVAGPDHTDKAVEQHMRMLRKEPFKYDSYTALRRIYMDAHQYDKAWCMCNTLAFLKKADPDELAFYEVHKPRGLIKAKDVMSSDTWGRLIHPDEDRFISAVLGVFWHGVAAMKAFPHKDFGVKRKDRRRLQGDPLMFSRLFYYVAQVLSVQLPEVYFVEDNKSTDIQLANAIEKNELCPSFVIRPHLLQGKSEREIAFVSARRLTFMRPEYYLKMLLPTNIELKVVVLSAIVMVQPRFPVPPYMVQLVQQYLPELKKRMSPQLFQPLGVAAARFLQAAPEINLAVARWGHAVDATSHRAGFVVCGDLEVAARMVSAEPVVTGGPQVKDRIKELVLYSISEEFFAVRAQMGLTIAG